MPASNDNLTRSLIRKFPGGPFALRHPGPFAALLVVDGLWQLILGAILLSYGYYWGAALWLGMVLLVWVACQIQPATST
jgi:hypothetical protein